MCDNGALHKPVLFILLQGQSSLNSSVPMIALPRTTDEVQLTNYGIVYPQKAGNNLNANGKKPSLISYATAIQQNAVPTRKRIGRFIRHFQYSLGFQDPTFLHFSPSSLAVPSQSPLLALPPFPNL